MAFEKANEAAPHWFPECYSDHVAEVVPEATSSRAVEVTGWLRNVDSQGYGEGTSNLGVEILSFASTSATTMSLHGSNLRQSRWSNSEPISIQYG
ncbi:hypothetical protein FHT86_004370 [Rhizobium sp. BK313]|nr:hypothetical protein [Rhizobium sp. BK313]